MTIEDCKASRVIMRDGYPVIGTLLNPPVLNSLVTAEVTFFSDYATAPKGKLQAWKQRMWKRSTGWMPRYYGDFGDRNATGQYQERIVAGRTQVLRPSGYNTPPDGWLITPAWDFDRCIGQWLHLSHGVSWIPSPHHGVRTVARMYVSSRKEFLPLENYYP